MAANPATAVKVSRKHKVFVVPHRKDLASIIPGTKPFQNGKEKLLAVPHTIETAKLGRNLGLLVPAPITSYYDWNGDKPFRTQKITAAVLTMNSRAYVLSQMGTGKTRAALFALDYLMKEKVINRALVIAPLSTLTLVWAREIMEHFPDRKIGVLYGPKAQRLKVLNEDHDFYILNHDGLQVIHREIQPRTDIQAVVIDELAVFRNARTTRWKLLNSFCSARPYVWGLTGSPTPNEPTDAWGQCRLLTPRTVPSFFGQFRRNTMTQISQFRWIAKKEATEIVYEAMQPGVRFTRDECVELPPVSYTDRQVDLSAEQKQAYDTILKKLRIAYKHGDVTAANEGVLFSKLLQISSGWVYATKNGAKQVIDLNPKPRLDALMGVLDENDGKTIVFVDFIHAAMQVEHALAKAGYITAAVSGDTPKKARDEIFGNFQNHPFPRVLVAHPKCMAHGLSLTAASTIVWYTPTTSLETYEQACARISRPGQTSKQLICHLTGTPIESKLYRRLRQKAKLQGALLEMFEEGDT